MTPEEGQDRRVPPPPHPVRKSTKPSGKGSTPEESTPPTSSASSHDKPAPQPARDSSFQEPLPSSVAPTFGVRLFVGSLIAVVLLVLALLLLRNWLFDQEEEGSGSGGQVVQPLRADRPSTDEEIACAFTFHNLSSDDLDIVENAIRSFCKDQHFDQQGRGSSATHPRVSYSFTVPGGLTRVAELDSVISHRIDDSGEPSLMYDQFDAKFTTNYQTASLTGSVRIIVNFNVAPGSKLYYSLEPDTEVKVDDSEIVNGVAQLQVRIPRNQSYIYGRTVLGSSERFLRIDISTDQAEEIDQSEYENRGP